MTEPADLILLVDDEAPICLVLGEVLRDAGFEVRDALNAVEAAAVLEAEGPALRLLITDINMGARGWGFGFARRVRDQRPGLPVIYITADSEAAVATHGLPDATVLPKPFLPNELVGAVRQAIAGARRLAVEA
jgi:CheY-like chemotaxis protein